MAHVFAASAPSLQVAGHPSSYIRHPRLPHKKVESKRISTQPSVLLNGVYNSRPCTTLTIDSNFTARLDGLIRNEDHMLSELEGPRSQHRPALKARVRIGRMVRVDGGVALGIERRVFGRAIDDHACAWHMQDVLTLHLQTLRQPGSAIPACGRAHIRKLAHLHAKLGTRLGGSLANELASLQRHTSIEAQADVAGHDKAEGFRRPERRGSERPGDVARVMLNRTMRDERTFGS